MANFLSQDTCLSQKNCLIIGSCHTNDITAKANELVITTRQSVTILKESETKPCHIWTSKPSQPLTCAAICDASTNQYAACINHKFLVWDSTTPDITKIKPTKVEGRIQRLFPLPSGGCVILYSDGAVCTTGTETLAERVKESRKGFLKIGEDIVDSCLWSSEDGVFVVCLVVKTKQYSICCIRVPKMDQPHSQEQCTRVSLDASDEHSLQHTSFYTTSNELYMYYVGTDGQLYQCSISHTDLAHSKGIPCKPVMNLPVDKRHDDKVKHAIINPSLVALVGLEGEYADHLCLWDTKYGVLVAKQQLQNSTDKTAVTVSNIIYTANHIWMSTNQGITACRIDSAPSTLSMALGKQSALDEGSRLPVAGQQWTLDDQGDVAEVDMDTDETSHSKKYQVLEELLNRKKVKTAKQFNTTVQKLLSDSDKTTIDMPTALCTVLKYVCERCKEDKKFWPRDGLTAIVQTRLVPASSCTDFMSCVIDKGDVSLLVTCLQHMQDIPDDTLAHIIEFVLRDLSSNGDLSSQTNDSQTDPQVDCPVSPDTAQLINLVLLCPMNDIYMMECLSKVKFQQIVVLLKYLYYLLNAIQTGNGKDQERLPANVVIDWVLLILDAHYSQLVLSIEARTLLLNLHQSVQLLSHYYDEVDAVHNILKEIKSTTSQAPKAKSDAVYSIEILNL